MTSLFSVVSEPTAFTSSTMITMSLFSSHRWICLCGGVLGRRPKKEEREKKRSVITFIFNMCEILKLNITRWWLFDYLNIIVTMMFAFHINQLISTWKITSRLKVRKKKTRENNLLLYALPKGLEPPFYFIFIVW